MPLKTGEKTNFTINKNTILYLEKKHNLSDYIDR